MRVLIVDDHPIIASGCRALLETGPSVEVYEASDARAGFTAFLARKPDVAIIDINLPGFSGLELLRRILLREPDARLVIFSMNDDPVIAARAIEAGAKGYIAKNDDPSLFADAVKTVADGGHLPPSGDGATDRLPPGGRQRHDDLRASARENSKFSA